MISASPLLTFQDVIERRGCDPTRARLVRHSRDILASLRRGRKYFDFAITYQMAVQDPFAKAEFAFQFVPGPTLVGGDASALFVAAHRIVDSWPFDDGVRRTDMHLEPKPWPIPPHATAYQLEPLTAFDDLSERLLIRWGKSSRAWSQWAGRGAKEVVELRRDASDPPFPGFARFCHPVADLPIMPQAWQAALGSVGGVYLLVAQTGEQYVGAAHGAGGFLARWLAYAADGHGGNLRLRTRAARDYVVSILEVASPDMSFEDVLAREVAWKRKLGSRVHGLNAN